VHSETAWDCALNPHKDHVLVLLSMTCRQARPSPLEATVHMPLSQLHSVHSTSSSQQAVSASSGSPEQAEAPASNQATPPRNRPTFPGTLTQLFILPGITDKHAWTQHARGSP